MNEEVTTYENHAQDSRVREEEVCPTIGASNANGVGTGGNNPLVLATFGKVGHAVNADGDGEKYAEVEVAQTLNTFQNQCEGRAVELCVGFSHVASGMMLDCQPSPVSVPLKRSPGGEGAVCLSAQRARDTMVAKAVCIDGNKLCKNERAGGSGLGVSEDEVSYTETANDIHAVAIRTANTHANGHGVADEATHTLDRASGQAVCVGVDTYNQSISPNVMHTLHHHDGLDNQPKVCVEATGLTMTLDRFHQTGVEEVANTLRTSSAQGDNAPTICIDAYNQSATEESCMTLRSAMTGTDGNDADPKVVTNGVAIGIDGYNQAATGEVSKTLNSVKSDADHTPMVATMLKVRCGKDTYTKSDGSVGTAGKGPLASEESAFTLAATQGQSLVLRHIVRRLSPTECSRLQGFPDQWCRIPMGKWRKIDEAEADYLRSQGAWVESHIRPRKDGGTETDLAPDSPMYKADGNSWATNCAEWILRRIVAAIRLGMIGGQE